MDPISIGALTTAAITAAAGAGASYGISALAGGGAGGKAPPTLKLPTYKPPMAPLEPVGAAKPQGMQQSFLAGALGAPTPTRGAGKTLLGQ